MLITVPRVAEQIGAAVGELRLTMRVFLLLVISAKVLDDCPCGWTLSSRANIFFGRGSDISSLSRFLGQFCALLFSKTTTGSTPDDFGVGRESLPTLEVASSRGLEFVPAICGLPGSSSAVSIRTRTGDLFFGLDDPRDRRAQGESVLEDCVVRTVVAGLVVALDRGAER